MRLTSKRERQFPELALGSIFYFADYAKAISKPTPTADGFRSFVKQTNRSHGLLVKTVDRIEHQMQRLVVERTYRHQDGQLYTASNYTEAQATKSKRTGKLTNYGSAFREFAEYVRELYDFMIQEGDAASVLKQLRRQRELLEIYRRDPLDDGRSHTPPKRIKD